MKKPTLFIAVICSVLVLASLGDAASAGSLAIALPPDRSIVESESITLVLKNWPPAIDAIRASINGKELAVAKKTERPAHLVVRLSHGLNSILITGFQDGKKTGELTTRVFYRVELLASADTPPAEFRKYLFHTDANEKECSRCHRLDFRKADVYPDAPEQSPCYQCHKKLLDDYQFAHGPSALWSCLMCHDGTSRNPKLAVVTPDRISCAGCHDKIWGVDKHMHGPSASGACTLCHNPHASDRKFFLRREPVALCTSCHPEVLTEPHAINFFSTNRGHPVQKSPDPFNPGTDLTCISCHNPHGSNSPVFLKTGGETVDMYRFCQSCHRM